MLDNENEAPGKMSHTQMIEQAANRFYMEFESRFQPGNPYDTSWFKAMLPGTLRDWSEEGDQMSFLRALETRINSEKQKHFANHHHGEETDCPEINFYNELLYFINQTVKRLNKTHLSGDYYTQQEKLEILSRIDEVLIRINEIKNELQSGQEVIYNEIEALKSRLDLDKKTFMKVVKGTVLEIVVKNVLDSAKLSWIYETLTGEKGPRLLN